jgi:hypothetical protein
MQTSLAKSRAIKHRESKLVCIGWLIFFPFSKLAPSNRAVPRSKANINEQTLFE